MIAHTDATLNALAEPLKGRVIPYAIELDEGRGERLRVNQMRFGHGLSLVGDAFGTLIDEETMSLLFLNPPYDYAYEQKGTRRQRLELHFLKQFTPTLYTAGGVLVYVVPHSILRNLATTRFLAANYENFNIVRFDDANDIYKQIVIYATRKEEPDYDNDTTARLTALGNVEWANLPDITTTPVPTDNAAYWLPNGNCQEPILFRHNALEPEELAELAMPIHLEHMAPSRKKIGRRDVRTATPPRAGHVSMLIAAGVTNGTLLQIDDPDYEPEQSDADKEDSDPDGIPTFADASEWKVLGSNDLAALMDPSLDKALAHMSSLIHAPSTSDDPKQDGVKIITPSANIPQLAALLKGRTRKVIDVSFETDDVSTANESKTARRTIRKERPQSEIVLLDERGNSHVVTPKEMPAFLTRHMPALTSELNRRMRPYYDFSSMNGFEKAIRRLNPHRRIPNTNRKGLMAAQMHAVAAAATVLQHESSAVVVGEMGTGKTLMGTGVAAALHGKGQFKRGVVICPPHLVPKWAEEIKLTWPKCRTLVIRKPRDIETLYEHPGPILGIVKSTTLSLGSGWEHAFDYVGPATLKTRADKKKFVFTRLPKPWIMDEKVENVMDKPVIGKSSKRASPEGASRFMTYRNRRGIRCPTCGHKQNHQLTDFRNKRLFCQNPDCRQALFHFQRDFDRWPLSRLFKRAAKRYGKLDLVIADEVHQYKAQGTDRGYAFGHMTGSTRKTLALTGTLFGGKAETIFWLLYRMMPDFQRAFTNTGAKGMRRILDENFAKEYGLLQETETLVERDGQTSGNSQSNIYKKEIPGLVPGLINWLLPYCVFLNLSDLGYALPPYQEHKVSVPLSPAMASEYHRVKGELYDAVSKALVLKDKGLLGSYLSVLLTWPEIPSRVRTVRDRDDNLIATTRPFPEETLTPKEEAILAHIKRSLKDNRKVMLYLEMTARTDITPRWKDLLKRAGISSAVCTADPDKRIEWFERERNKGTQVILVHPKRVELGMDLYAWPEVIWMHENTYSSYLVQQASRRAWRIGQTEPVNVTFYYYADTMQEPAMLVTQVKALASLRANGGIIDDDSLADIGGVDDMERMLGEMFVKQGEVEQKLAHARLYLADLENGIRQGPTAASFTELSGLPLDELITAMEKIVSDLEGELAAMNPAATLDSLFAQKTAVIDGIRTGHTTAYIGVDGDAYSEDDMNEEYPDEHETPSAFEEWVDSADLDALDADGGDELPDGLHDVTTVLQHLMTTLDLDDVTKEPAPHGLAKPHGQNGHGRPVDNILPDAPEPEPVAEVELDFPVVFEEVPSPFAGDTTAPYLVTGPNAVAVWQLLDEDDQEDALGETEDGAYWLEVTSDYFEELLRDRMDDREWIYQVITRTEEELEAILFEQETAVQNAIRANRGTPGYQLPERGEREWMIHDRIVDQVIAGQETERQARATEPAPTGQILFMEIADWNGSGLRHFVVAGRDVEFVNGIKALSPDAGTTDDMPWVEITVETEEELADILNRPYRISRIGPEELESELYWAEDDLANEIRRTMQPGAKPPTQAQRRERVRQTLITQRMRTYQFLLEMQAAAAPVEAAEPAPEPPVTFHKIPSYYNVGCAAFLVIGPDTLLLQKELRDVTFSDPRETYGIPWITIEEDSLFLCEEFLTRIGRAFEVVEAIDDELEAMLYEAEEAIRDQITEARKADPAYRLPTRDEREWMTHEWLVVKRIEAYQAEGNGDDDDDDSPDTPPNSDGPTGDDSPPQGGGAPPPAEDSVAPAEPATGATYPGTVIVRQADNPDNYYQRFTLAGANPEAFCGRQPAPTLIQRPLQTAPDGLPYMMGGANFLDEQELHAKLDEIGLPYRLVFKSDAEAGAEWKEIEAQARRDMVKNAFLNNANPKSLDAYNEACQHTIDAALEIARTELQAWANEPPEPPKPEEPDAAGSEQPVQQITLDELSDPRLGDVRVFRALDKSALNLLTAFKELDLRPGPSGTMGLMPWADVKYNEIPALQTLLAGRYEIVLNERSSDPEEAPDGRDSAEFQPRNSALSAQAESVTQSPQNAPDADFEASTVTDDEPQDAFVFEEIPPQNGKRQFVLFGKDHHSLRAFLDLALGTDKTLPGATNERFAWVQMSKEELDQVIAFLDDAGHAWIVTERTLERRTALLGDATRYVDNKQETAIQLNRYAPIPTPAERATHIQARVIELVFEDSQVNPVSKPVLIKQLIYYNEENIAIPIYRITGESARTVDKQLPHSLLDHAIDIERNPDSTYKTILLRREEMLKVEAFLKEHGLPVEIDTRYEEIPDPTRANEPAPPTEETPAEDSLVLAAAEEIGLTFFPAKEDPGQLYNTTSSQACEALYIARNDDAIHLMEAFARQGYTPARAWNEKAGAEIQMSQEEFERALNALGAYGTKRVRVINATDPRYGTLYILDETGVIAEEPASREPEPPTQKTPAETDEDENPPLPGEIVFEEVPGYPDSPDRWYVVFDDQAHALCDFLEDTNFGYTLQGESEDGTFWIEFTEDETNDIVKHLRDISVPCVMRELETDDRLGIVKQAKDEMDKILAEVKKRHPRRKLPPQKDLDGHAHRIGISILASQRRAGVAPEPQAAENGATEAKRVLTAEEKDPQFGQPHYVFKDDDATFVLGVLEQVSLPAGQVHRTKSGTSLNIPKDDFPQVQEALLSHGVERIDITNAWDDTPLTDGKEVIDMFKASVMVVRPDTLGETAAILELDAEDPGGRPEDDGDGNRLTLIDEGPCYTATGRDALTIADLLDGTGVDFQTGLSLDTEGQPWIEINVEDGPAAIADIIKQGYKVQVTKLAAANAEDEDDEEEFATITLFYDGTHYTAYGEHAWLVTQQLSYPNPPVPYTAGIAADNEPWLRISPDNIDRAIGFINERDYVTEIVTVDNPDAANAQGPLPTENGTKAKPDAANAKDPQGPLPTENGTKAKPDAANAKDPIDEFSFSGNPPFVEHVYRTWKDHHDMIAKRATIPDKIIRAMNNGSPLNNPYTMTEDRSRDMPFGNYLPVYEDGQLYLYRLIRFNGNNAPPPPPNGKYTSVIGSEIILTKSVIPRMFIHPERWKVVVD